MSLGAIAALDLAMYPTVLIAFDQFLLATVLRFVPKREEPVPLNPTLNWDLVGERGGICGERSCSSSSLTYPNFDLFMAGLNFKDPIAALILSSLLFGPPSFKLLTLIVSLDGEKWGLSSNDLLWLSWNFFLVCLSTSFLKVELNYSAKC